jgi:hypothetical protein
MESERNFSRSDLSISAEVFMVLRFSRILLLAACALVVVTLAVAQQPAGVADALRNLTSEHASHTSITFDRDMLQAADGFLNDGSGPTAQLNSITFETYHYSEPAFYIPETLHALVGAYDAAGWKHLVDQHASAKDSAAPHKPLTDLWLHFSGADIDAVTVVVRGVKQMNVIEVSGSLRPLDLVHLSGHFGIPKVDPGAVMVPAPAGR